MRTGKLQVCFPVDHRSSFSGYHGDEAASQDETRPWPARRRLAVFVVIALAAWIAVLSPLLLIG